MIKYFCGIISLNVAREETGDKQVFLRIFLYDTHTESGGMRKHRRISSTVESHLLIIPFITITHCSVRDKKHNNQKSHEVGREMVMKNLL